MPVPTPRRDEEQRDFMRRCVRFLRQEGYGQEQSVAICIGRWRRSRSAAQTPRATAPSPLRDLPPEVVDTFDRATRVGWAGVESDFLAAAELLSASWTIGQVADQLVRNGHLEGLLTGADGAEQLAVFRTRLRDSWQGPVDAAGLRSAAGEAPLVLVFGSASDGAIATSPVRDGWWSFGRWEREAISWAETSSGARITAIDSQTRDGMRAILSEAFRDGRDREAISRILRTLDADGSLRLGLDARRARTLYNFVETLDPDLDSAKRARRIDDKYRQLLRQRADLIAQSEVVEAANEAQVVTLEAAAREGELDARKYVLEWVARTLACQDCAPFDGATREVTSGRFIADFPGPRGISSAIRPEIHPGGW